jgi:CubicO group peptidase (beta-lactamase class C family)
MRRLLSFLRLLPLAALPCVTLILAAASLPTSTKPEDVGLSAERLQRIHQMIQRHIDAGDITGAVTLVARKGQIAWIDAAGVMDLETKAPMKRDSLFRMASMTKPVIGTAMMMMIEEGKVSISDPVSKFIPEFKNIKVGILQSPGVGRGAGATPPKYYTVPADRELTVKELLTHTSGLVAGPMGQNAVAPLRRKPEETLADFIPRLAQTPLEFQPGARWMYSASDGFDPLGRIIEIASGKPLNVFLKERIFDPLDMSDTHHYPTDAQLSRLASVYQKRADGLVKTPFDQSMSMSSKVYFASGGGLISTVDDYSHFAQMLANGGELYGHRLLSPRTVKYMASVHIPDTLPGRAPGEGFGLTVRVVQDAIAGNIRISDGSFGWSGVYGTHFWVDPKEEIVAVMMCQTSIGSMRNEFENAVMQAIVK